MTGQNFPPAGRCYVPTREGAQTKGRRYVVEGRLTVTEVGPGRVRAICKGQGELYRLALHGGGWICSCPAKGLCAHLVAPQLVVTEQEGR